MSMMSELAAEGDRLDLEERVANGTATVEEEIELYEMEQNEKDD